MSTSQIIARALQAPNRLGFLHVHQTDSAAGLADVNAEVASSHDCDKVERKLSTGFPLLPLPTLRTLSLVQGQPALLRRAP